MKKPNAYIKFHHAISQVAKKQNLSHHEYCTLHNTPMIQWRAYCRLTERIPVSVLEMVRHALSADEN